MHVSYHRAIRPVLCLWTTICSFAFGQQWVWDDDGATARIEGVQRLWDADPHSAFTDLARVGDDWLCVFRVGSAHVSPDGRIQVLRSRNGREWVSGARIRQEGVDLRDPKICRAPSGEWMLTAVGAAPKEGRVRHQTYAWFSRDGDQWGDPVAVGDPDVWLWRITWQGPVAYGLGYSTTEDRFIRLYRSTDGRQFETWVARFGTEGYVNEHSLGTDENGDLLCLLRRDGNPGTALLGRARPPYKDWKWTDLGVALGGPHWVFISRTGWIAGVRLHEPEPHTAIVAVDPHQVRVRRLVRLPSGGDTSYPGLVWHEDRLWISYYSSHEGRSAIYLARVRFDFSPEL